MDNKVYIISGPAGVGKSTTSKELAKVLKSSAYISGDDISHMHINGREKPWESEEEVSLIWNNILSLTINFLRYGNDVVIDYVTFPKEAKWFNASLKEWDIEVKYTVLWTDSETLIRRDKMRSEEHRMGKRCLVLVDEFIDSGLDERYILDTSDSTSDQIVCVPDEIINNQNYIIT